MANSPLTPSSKGPLGTGPSQPVHFRVSEAQNKIYVTYNKKTYAVEIFETVGGREQPVFDPSKNWEEVAHKVLDYLKTLETSGGQFKLAQMKSADIHVQGPDLSNPKIQQVEWTAKSGETKSLTRQEDLGTKAAQPKIQALGEALKSVRASQSSTPSTQSSPSPASSSSSSPASSSSSAAPKPELKWPALKFPADQATGKQKEGSKALRVNHLLSEAEKGIVNEGKESKDTPSNHPMKAISFNSRKQRIAALEFKTRFMRYLDDGKALEEGVFKYTEAELEKIFKCLEIPEGANPSWLNNLSKSDQAKLRTILEKNDPPATKQDRQLMLKGFRCYCEQGEMRKPPKAYFKAVAAALNDTGLVSASYESNPEKQVKIVVLTGETKKYQIKGEYPPQAKINPSKTIFIHDDGKGNFQGLRISDPRDSDLLGSLKPAKRTRPAYLSPNDLVYDVGAKGNCTVRVLTVAEDEKKQEFLEYKDEFDTHVETRSAQIRREVANHMFDKPQEFLEQYDLVAQALQEQGADRDIKRFVTDDQTRENIKTVLGLPLTSINEKDKIAIIKLYATLAAHDGVWLDLPFFHAYAKKFNIPIFIIQDCNGKNKIQAVIGETSVPIQEKTGLFIFYNGSDHYSAVNRNHKDFQTIINQYEQEHAHLKPREEFLKILNETQSERIISPEKISQLREKLEGLKKNDPIGYRALQRKVGENLLEKFEKDPNSDLTEFLKATKELSKHIEQYEITSKEIQGLNLPDITDDPLSIKINDLPEKISDV